GFAEFVRVPAGNVRAATFRVPDHLTDEEASFVEPLACCLRAVERARVQPGDTALVVGLGSIGCLFVQLFARAGAQVVGVDQDASRADLARRFGATAALPADAATLAREPARGEIVVRIDAALTCGTDVKVRRRGHPVMIPRVPTVFGHEFSGTVTAVGAGVSRVREGDRVAAANSAPCGECRPCLAQRPNLCEDL